MEITDLQIGNKVEILVNFGTESRSFSSEIIQILEDNRILIDEIKHEDRSVGFSGNNDVSLIHVGEKLHQWKYITVKLVRYQTQRYHCVILDGSGTPYNRRDTFRLFLGMDCELHFATDKGVKRKSVILKDVSEGGFAFLSEEEVPLNKNVRIQLTDGSFSLDMRAKIVRITLIETQRKTLHGCRLIHPEPSLVKYIRFKQSTKKRD